MDLLRVVGEELAARSGEAKRRRYLPFILRLSKG